MACLVFFHRILLILEMFRMCSLISFSGDAIFKQLKGPIFVCIWFLPYGYEI
jgi:hypothetical protein